MAQICYQCLDFLQSQNYFGPSKMISFWTGPICSGRVKIVFDGSNFFWTSPNNFEQVQFKKLVQKKSNFNLSKINIGPVQYNFESPKSFWTYV